MSEIRRSLLAYVASAVACAVILGFALEIANINLHVPLSYGRDALCMQLWVKGIVENGWYLKNPSLGAPFGMTSYDFPLSDNLFFLAIAAIGRITRDSIVTINLYYFLTYFLTSLITLFVLRRLGVPRMPAAVAGLLYAFLPAHMFRAEQHLLLASYFLVPPAVLVCVWLIRDGELLFREAEGGRARLRLGGRRAIAALVVCALMGAGGVYYSFFTCYLLLVAGVVAAAARRRVHPLGSAVLLVAMVTASSVANIAPNIRYIFKHGPNPVSLKRSPDQVDKSSLRIAQLILPIPRHRVEAFARSRRDFDNTQQSSVTENGAATLGLVGSLGFLGLLALAVVRRPVPSGTMRGLASLNLAALLLATTGGLGMIFGLLVSPVIRNYGRISVFIGFLGLTAAALVMARLSRAARPGWQRLAVNLGLPLVLVLGILDQTSPRLVPDSRRFEAEIAVDREFVGRIEAMLPPRAMVFQLPLIDYPEGSEPGQMGPYDHARAYLHSKSLRWSFGAMRGRQSDAWQEHAADQPTPNMLRTLALAGFSGVWVDRAGYADRGAFVERELGEALHASPIISNDGRRTFYDLRPFTGALVAELGPERFASERADALRPMATTWDEGFYEREEGATRVAWHWSPGEGRVRIANPSDRPRKVVVTMGLATFSQKESDRIQVEGPGVKEDWPANSAQRLELTLPPGGATLQFRTDAEKRRNFEGDPRTLAFRVEGFRVAEIKADAPAIATTGGPTVK